MNDDTAQIGVPNQQRMTRRELVTRGADAISPAAASTVSISRSAGGLEFRNATDVLEFAKMMAVAGAAVPEHCQGNPGVCLALTMQAVEWRVSPFAVAQKSYVVNGRIGYESQLVHAVIEARAPITTRLQHRFEGKGDAMKCYVFATFAGENEPRYWPPFAGEDGAPLDDASDAYTLGKLRPGFGSKFEVDEKTGQKTQLRRGSPLWEKKPALQMFYNISRDWARVYCPDVLLGIYTRDELQQNPNFGRDQGDATVEAGLIERIRSDRSGDEGYRDGHVEQELAQVAPNAGGSPEFDAGSRTPEVPERTAGVDTAQKGARSSAEGVPARQAGKPARRQGASRTRPSGRPGSAAAAKAEPAKAEPKAGSKPAPAADPPRTTTLERGRTTKGAATRAADRAAETKAAEAPKSRSQLKTALDYVAYAKAAIDAHPGPHSQAMADYDEERDIRDRLSVSIQDRRMLEDRINNKFGA